MSKHSSEPRSLFFDPDEHPDNTLKAFNEFTQMFELRYNAQYTDPPKVSIESAIERWKLINATQIQPNPKPSIVQYDLIRAEWRSKDRVTKFLGMFSSSRLYTDWQAALPNARDRDTATWQQFLTTMQDYYKPTENPTLKNYQFRALAQETTETFPAFCNRVTKEAKHCHFNCTHNDCTKQAKTWNLLEQMIPTKTKIRPYHSKPIDVYGIARCVVTFGATSIPVEWHILSGSCDPILSGVASTQLGIIEFKAKPAAYQPVLMIDTQLKPQDKQSLQSILEQYQHNFTGLGKL